jgi:phosphoglycerate dehydrogenase-like enzyme
MTTFTVATAPVACWTDFFRPDPAFRELGIVDASPETLAAAEICIGFPGAEQIAAMPRLRWLQLMSAGADRWRQIPPEVVITTANPVFAEPASEHALALLLALGRDLPTHFRLGLEHRWGRSGATRDLARSTVVVVGIGYIGQAIATRLKAFGARVIGVRRNLAKGFPPGVDEVIGIESLEAALARADALVLALPLTSESERLVTRRHLEALKPGALVVNVGRGKTLDQDALVDGLVSGRIGGAGLDVTVPEPLPSDHPLWGFPNVIITGHSLGNSPGRTGRRVALVAAQLERWRKGETLLHRLDRNLGY